MKDTREIIAENSLTPYETALFKGLKTTGSETLKSKIISEAVTGVMNSTIEVDGQVLSVTEALVIKVTGEALANPSTSNLKDLAAITGDAGSTKIELVNSQVDDDLARATIGVGGSALGKSGGIISLKAGVSAGSKAASMGTSKGVEVAVSKATTALVQAGIAAGKGFTEAMADPLVKQITYDSDAIVEAYGDEEAVKQTLYNASMAALSSAAISMAQSAVPEGVTYKTQGKERYYANYFTSKAALKQQALNKVLQEWNSKLEKGETPDWRPYCSKIEKITDDLSNDISTAQDYWDQYRVSRTEENASTVYDKSGNAMLDEQGNVQKKAGFVFPRDSETLIKELDRFEAVVNNKNLTDAIFKNRGKWEVGDGSTAVNTSSGNATIVSGNLAIEYDGETKALTYTDTSDPNLTPVEVKEVNGAIALAPSTHGSLEAVASLVASQDSKALIPDTLNLPLKNGSASVLISDFKTPEQIRTLASLKEEDLRKVGNLEIADLKDGRAIVFSDGRKTAQIENYDGSFQGYLKEIETKQKVFGDFVDGTYNARDGKDDFGTIQAASRAMPDRYVQEYHAGKGIDEGLRKRISRVFELAIDASAGGRGYHKQSLLNPKTNTKAVICDDVDNKVFDDVFEMARKFLKNGELVDLHESETADGDIGYNDCECFLSEDGLLGFAITKESKDLISVFSLWKEGGFLKTVAPIIQEKAKTLDGYISNKQPLDYIYAKALGFKVAAVMDWNDEYDHDDIGANHGSPKVAFMVNPKFATREIELKTFGKDEYDKAKAWQLSFVTSAKEEVEARYGKDVSKAPASLIIEAGNAKEGKTYNLTNTAKTINKIEEALQGIVSGDVPEVAMIEARADEAQN